MQCVYVPFALWNWAARIKLCSIHFFFSLDLIDCWTDIDIRRTSSRNSGSFEEERKKSREKINERSEIPFIFLHCCARIIEKNWCYPSLTKGIQTICPSSISVSVILSRASNQLNWILRLLLQIHCKKAFQTLRRITTTKKKTNT